MPFLSVVQSSSSPQPEPIYQKHIIQTKYTALSSLVVYLLLMAVFSSRRGGKGGAIRVIGLRLRIRVQGISLHIILRMWSLWRFQVLFIASLEHTIFVNRCKSKIQSCKRNDMLAQKHLQTRLAEKCRVVTHLQLALRNYPHYIVLDHLADEERRNRTLPERHPADLLELHESLASGIIG